MSRIDLGTVHEGVSAVMTATLTDAAGVALPTASLGTLTATLYDERTGQTINSRASQNILGANGGSVSIAGVLTLQLAPADSALVTQHGDSEPHVLLLEWTWAAGAGRGRQEYLITVENLQRVTA